MDSAAGNLVRGLSLVGAILLIAAAPARSQEVPSLATGWRIFHNEEARARAELPPGVVGLLAEEVQRAGWSAAVDTRDEPDPAGVLRIQEGTIALDLARPALLICGGDPRRTRATLDDWLELRAVSARPGGSVVLLPPGRHELRLAEVPILRNLLEWWGAVLGAMVVAALAGLAAHRLVARRDRDRGPPPAPLPWGRLALVLLICGVAWSWISSVDLVAIDYPMAPYVSSEIQGLVAGAWEIRGETFAEIMGNSLFFRPVHHTVYALELAAFGPSGFWLHLMSLLWHLGNVALLFVVLHRVLPRGAAMGALLGGLWPVAGGQALTWLVARQFPMALFFGLAALLFAQRYLRTGRAAALAGCGAMLWLSAGCKESGVMHLGLVAIFAPMMALPWWRTRRTLALWGSVAAIIVLYYGVRLLFGYGLSRGYGGLSYRTPLHVFIEGAENLPEVFQGAFALTNLDPAHGLPCWIAAGTLAIFVALAGWRVLFVTVAAFVYAVIATLPDVIWARGDWCTPSLTRGLYILALVGWGVLAAGALSGGIARAPSRLRLLPWGLVLILAVATALGHWAEWEVRRGLAEVAADWVQTSATLAEEHESDRGGAAPPYPLTGPAGLLIVGRPAPPELEGMGVIIGPSLADSIAPPFAERAWIGRNFSTWGQARESDFLARYPWEVVVLASEEHREPPTFRRRLACRSGRLPAEADLVALEGRSDARRWSLELGDIPPREIRCLELIADAELPPGTRLTLRLGSEAGSGGQTSTRLLLPRRAGKGILLPTASFPGWLETEAATGLEVSVELPGGLPGPGLRVRLVGELDRLDVIGPAPGAEIVSGDLLPPIRWRDPGQAETYRLTLGADERHRPSGFAPTVVPIPRAVLQPVASSAGGVEFEVDLIAHFGLPAAVWHERVAHAASTHLNFDGMWLLLELRGTIGEPPWLQSVSRLIPVKLRF